MEYLISFDERDEEIRQDRLEARSAHRGPIVGDYVFMPGEEKPRRFTHNWGDALQTTCKGSHGSFYLMENGLMSFSGALDPAIPRDRLMPTGELRAGACWFFHHNFSGAGRGVDTAIPCRVWTYAPEEEPQTDDDEILELAEITRNLDRLQNFQVRAFRQGKADKAAGLAPMVEEWIPAPLGDSSSWLDAYMHGYNADAPGYRENAKALDEQEDA